jgi:hypothetical protein
MNNLSASHYGEEGRLLLPIIRAADGAAFFFV